MEFLTRAAIGCLLIATVAAFTGCSTYVSEDITLTPTYAPTKTHLERERSVPVAVTWRDARKPDAPIGQYRSGSDDGMQLYRKSNLSWDFSGLETGMQQALQTRGFALSETSQLRVLVNLTDCELILTDASPMGTNVSTEYSLAITISVMDGDDPVYSKRYSHHRYGEIIHAMRDLRKHKSIDGKIHVEFFEPPEYDDITSDWSTTMSELIDKAVADPRFMQALTP